MLSLGFSHVNLFFRSHTRNFVPQNKQKHNNDEL